MSGHGGFSVIGSGMKLPQPVELPKSTELKPGGDKLGALNVEGPKTEVKVADTRLEQANRLSSRLDAPLRSRARCP